VVRVVADCYRYLASEARAIDEIGVKAKKSREMRCVLLCVERLAAAEGKNDWEQEKHERLTTHLRTHGHASQHACLALSKFDGTLRADRSRRVCMSEEF
jgi:hypothetical protein